MRPDAEAYRKRAAEILDQAYQKATQARTGLETTVFTSLATAAEKGRFEINDPEHYLDQARERILSGDSMIVYFGPHISGLPPDIGTVGNVIQTIVPLDRVAIYTAKKHLDPNRGNNRVKHALHGAEVAVIEEAQKTKGFRTIPVVHTPEYIAYYSEHRDALGGKTPNRFNAEAVKTGADFLLTGSPMIGGNALVIAPGGSRDSQAKLTPAHIGLEYTLKGARINTFALGLGLIPNARKNIPLFGKIEVAVGKPLTWEDVNDKYVQMQNHAIERGLKLGITRSDLMMIYLASLLPSKHQGHYKPLLARFPELANPSSW
jgi:hypothetical protein